MKLLKVMLLLVATAQVGMSLQADTVRPVADGTSCTSGGAKGQKTGARCRHGGGTVVGSRLGDGSVWCGCDMSNIED